MYVEECNFVGLVCVILSVLVCPIGNFKANNIPERLLSIQIANVSKDKSLFTPNGSLQVCIKEMLFSTNLCKNTIPHLSFKTNIEIFYKVSNRRWPSVGLHCSYL